MTATKTEKRIQSLLDQLAALPGYNYRQEYELAVRMLLRFVRTTDDGSARVENAYDWSLPID
jgi:hypothetical protein